MGLVIKNNCFYAYDGWPVVIKRVVKKNVLIEYIMQESDEDGDISETKKTEWVRFEDLEELTSKSIQKLIQKHSKKIGQYNRKIHALNECANYMHEE